MSCHLHSVSCMHRRISRILTILAFVTGNIPLRRVGLHGGIREFHVDKPFEDVRIEDAAGVNPMTCGRICA